MLLSAQVRSDNDVVQAELISREPRIEVHEEDRGVACATDTYL